MSEDRKDLELRLPELCDALGVEPDPRRSWQSTLDVCICRAKEQRQLLDAIHAKLNPPPKPWADEAARIARERTGR